MEKHVQRTGLGVVNNSSNPACRRWMDCKGPEDTLLEISVSRFSVCHSMNHFLFLPIVCSFLTKSS
ncbi:rCG37663 [Rattus norvegicus]|uniref:RCG37663 n=1 Tax=Rattus norvegicus TaxID=10116 RepID=A6JF42_RAT|nr:rCG37663 [Rattus norvegicus]